jgi:tetratricopeptide (TPR) repeat protein
MISARHDSWQALNRKRQQVHQLAHKQQRVVAAALGCDSAAAAAKLAALSAGQPVQELLQGFVSTCSARQSGAGTAAAVAALSGEGMGPLEDAAAVQELVADAQSLITELGYWEDGTAMLAWLLLRSGQLGRAASVADAHPNAFFEKEPLHSNKQWGWRWWVLAQVRWQQGELTVAKQLLQEGHAQLQKLAQHGANSSSSSGLWRLLLPAEQELPELLQQLQQLLSLKEAGNAAIQAKQYDKAAEAYTKALALQPSCGFAAVIHSNRAAALQQQKRLVEALADCSRAVALDPKYARAYLRWVAATVYGVWTQVSAYVKEGCWVFVLLNEFPFVAMAALCQCEWLRHFLQSTLLLLVCPVSHAFLFCRMAQVLESLHRADRAVVVLQDALKGAANAVDPATTRGHELTHGAALLQLGSADRRKFEDMLATAQVCVRVDALLLMHGGVRCDVCADACKAC